MLVTRRLPASAMRLLGGSFAVSLWEGDGPMPRERLLAAARGTAAIVSLLTDMVDAELLDAAGSALRVVANYAVGLDNVNVAECTRRGVLVTNTPDVLTDATADMAWALLLAAARRVAEGDRLVRSGVEWTWGPEMMLGRDVSGSTLGIVGLGRIGKAVALRARSFGMRVIATGRRHESGSLGDGSLGDGSAAEMVPLETLLAESDFVSLHVDLSPGTRHLMSAERLALMRPGAVLVNTSRGAVVDEEALADALDAGRLFAAGLDVFEAEPRVHPRLAASPRVVLAPHLGSATVGTREAMGRLVVENVLAALSGRRPPTLANPEALDRAGRPAGSGGGPG